MLLLAAPSRGAPVVSIAEDDAQLLRSGPVAREQALDDWAALGVDMVRIIVIWRDATPAALAQLDAAVAGARARGLQVLLTPTGPGPRAASRCRPRRDVCDPAPQAFGRWVGRLARRYPEVRSWAVWNEPNNAHWLQPQRTPTGVRSPRLYRALAQAASAAIRADPQHRADRILVGETAPVFRSRAEPPARQMVEADTFLRALLRAGGVPLADAISHHPYAGGLSSPEGRRAAAQYSLAGLPRLRAVAREARVRRQVRTGEVWLTELGFQTNPPDRFFGMPLARQASFIARAEEIATRGGAASIAQYVLVDERGGSGFQSGLRFADGRPKPSYGGYQAPLVVRARGRTATIWGRLRPVRVAGTPVTVIDGRGRTVWQGATGEGGLFTGRAARPSGRVRVRWQQADGTVLLGPWITPVPG